MPSTSHLPTRFAECRYAVVAGNPTRQDVRYANYLYPV